MSTEEIYKELINDLQTKIGNYVKTYEKSLTDLKIQALEQLAEKDSTIEALETDLREATERIRSLEADRVGDQ